MTRPPSHELVRHLLWKIRSRGIIAQSQAAVLPAILERCFFFLFFLRFRPFCQLFAIYRTTEKHATTSACHCLIKQGGLCAVTKNRHVAGLNPQSLHNPCTGDHKVVVIAIISSSVTG